MDHLSLFQKTLGYTFKTPKYLEEALHHPSCTTTPKSLNRGAFERLEFLGDRVLGLTISAKLFEMYPAEPEGTLVKLFNALVRKEAVAEVALALNLGDHMHTSRTEENSHKQNQTFLADGLEAILGAIMLDSHFEEARNVTLKLWNKKLQNPELDQNPKSLVQEWAQKNGFPLPQYIDLSHSGPDHQPTFNVQLSAGPGHIATGQGPSKKEAQRHAAENFIKSYINEWT